MKRKVLAALMAGTMALSLAACGGGGSSSGSSGGSSESAAGGDEHTLTLFAWDPNFNIPAMEAAGADYKENVDPDFNLEVIEQASSEDVETAITTAALENVYLNCLLMMLFRIIQKLTATIHRVNRKESSRTSLHTLKIRRHSCQRTAFKKLEGFCT